MKYEFILQDNNQKSFRLFTRFIFFFHIVAAGIIALNGKSGEIKTELFGFIGVFIALSILYYSFRKQQGWGDTLGVILILYCFIFWEINVGLIAAFIILAVFVLAMLVKKTKTFISISEKGLVFNRAFSKIKYSWNQLDNVVLKDGLLTIDLVSNRIMQVELTSENASVDESAFNRFCNDQLQNKA